MVTRQMARKGKFISEYKTATVYSPKQRAAWEERHKRNELGCYIIETKSPAYVLGRLCFNATERLHHPGHYINHVAQKPNIKLTWPFEVRGKPRIGFLALRDIPAGEELCYDYGD